MSFKETRIGDVLTLQRGFDITKAEQTDGEIPIVSSSGTSSYHNHWKVAGPGIVIGRKGTLGTTHFLASNFWPHDTTLWVKDFKGNDPKFLYYFLQTLHLENFDTGSSNPTLNRNHVHKITVRFPALLETQARELNPARWSGKTRNWSPVGAVTLNPERDCVIRALSLIHI